MELEIKNRAHDKAFATIFSLRHTKEQRKVWDYIALLIEKDHEKIDYLDYEKQNELT